MTGRWGRRRKQPLDDKGKKRFLEVERGSTRPNCVQNWFARGYGPVVRQTAEWMKQWINEDGIMWKRWKEPPYLCWKHTNVTLLIRGQGQAEFFYSNYTRFIKGLRNFGKHRKKCNSNWKENKTEILVCMSCFVEGRADARIQMA